MRRWALVEKQLRDFRRYLYDGFQPLDIRPLHDLTIHRQRNRAQYLAQRKSGLFSCCGVYLFFDATGSPRPLYIGSEVWAFDKRFLQHPDVLGARFIDVVCFDDCHWPFMLALEAFLIARLKPKHNKTFNGYNVQPIPKRTK